MKLLSHLSAVAVPGVALGILLCTTMSAKAETVKVDSITFISPTTTTPPNPPANPSGQSVKFDIDNKFLVTAGTAGDRYILTYNSVITSTGSGGQSIAPPPQTTEVMVNSLGTGVGYSGTAGFLYISGGRQTATASTSVTSPSGSSNSKNVSTDYWVGPSTTDGGTTTPGGPG